MFATIKPQTSLKILFFHIVILCIKNAFIIHSSCRGKLTHKVYREWLFFFFFFLLASVEISTHAPRIMLNEQHSMAYYNTMPKTKTVLLGTTKILQWILKHVIQYQVFCSDMTSSHRASLICSLTSNIKVFDYQEHNILLLKLHTVITLSG
jgi:hypothetical protein